ncbi:MAG: P-loop NTPase [Candidatus Diapherotrites archaeon]|nr:P-loop NTPase [Candidatus Diapherotrites archaeon]
MGKIIAILSGKGGVGKTTITAELGIALAKRNLKVCVVDADVAMANLSLLLSMQGAPITLHDVLLGESVIHDAIYDGPMGLKLVPSGLSLDSYRRVDPERLSSVLEKIAPIFDFILLDCPAGIERSVIAAVSAANEVLLLTTPSSPSIADVLKAKIICNRLNVKVIGVIINFVRQEKGEIKKEDISKILELPIYGLVPFDDELRQSFIQEKPVPLMVRSPGSPAALAIQKTASKLAGLPVQFDLGARREGFLSRLLSIFKRKPSDKPQSPRTIRGEIRR